MADEKIMKYKVLRTMDNQIIGKEYSSILMARIDATYYTLHTPFWHIVVDEHNNMVCEPFPEKALGEIPLIPEEE